MKKIEIVYKNLEEIMPYDNNPRQNDNAVPKVMESIKQFGFKVPIVIDSAGFITTGHTRYRAAMELGLEEVPCIVADDLTAREIAAFRLADNKVAEFSNWDFHLLENELAEIDGFIDMSDFGFDDFGADLDLDGLFEDAEPKQENSEPKTVTCPACGEVIEI